MIGLCAAGTSLAAELDVTVVIEGIEDGGLRGQVRQVSQIQRAADDAYGSLAPIRRAADADTQAIRDYLVAKGYYAATVTPQVRRAEDDVTVTFTVNPGRRFEITDYRIEYDEESAGERPQRFSDAGLKPDGQPIGESFQTLESGLLNKLWDDGYPAAESMGRRVEADFSKGTATAVFPIRSGPLSTYGDVRVEGETRTRPDHIAAYRTFEAGEIYSREDIDEYREALAETGLFREVQVGPAPPGPGGVTDVLVDVTERERRTIQAGASYSTDVGPGVTASWENRNLFRRGETLFARAAVAQPLQELELTFQKPWPRLPGSWKLSTLFQNENTDAYEAQSATVGASIDKWWLNRNLQTVAGLRYQISYIDETAGAGDGLPPPEGEDTTRTFQAVSIPLAVIWNNETSELNPTDGFRARALVEPFFGDTQFNRVVLEGGSRVGFGDDQVMGKSTLVAGRFRIGATYGADRADIPATERFFAGGGGSVRGYGYQEAGPLNVVEQGDGTLVYRDGTPFAFEVNEDGEVTNDPIVPIGSIGGASIAEGNVEFRQKITQNIQLAAFADAGTVFESQTPDFSGDLLVGAGLGVRYFTPIGPVRLDVAVPLNRRKLTASRTYVNDDGETVTEDETVFQDDFIGVYIALGQPF
ncbi:autotransporter assembly complex protein TamA [Parvularcula dongshanensis]|uniref:autotransporter assembly complex protein TamA n=1 Tax=Parvularcula dongshanensis TaxID=1173995 RepID=UPI00161F47DA|nr:BamA/TamA family outer membrane protein [Parvularcula dongshanensis]